MAPKFYFGATGQGTNGRLVTFEEFKRFNNDNATEAQYHAYIDLYYENHLNGRPCPFPNMLQENDVNSTAHQVPPAPPQAQPTTTQADAGRPNVNMTDTEIAVIVKGVVNKLAEENSAKKAARPSLTPSPPPPPAATAFQTPVDLTKGRTGASPTKKAKTGSGTKPPLIINWSNLEYESGKSLLEFFDVQDVNHFSDDTVQFSRGKTPIWCSNRLRDYYEVFEFAENATRKDQYSSLVTQTHNLKIAHYKLGHKPQLIAIANLAQYHFNKYRLESGIGYYTLIMTILTELPIGKRYNNLLQACYLSETDVHYILRHMFKKLTGPKQLELLVAIKQVELNVKTKYTSPFANARIVPE
jgi:hypothetical protein